MPELRVRRDDPTAFELFEEPQSEPEQGEATLAVERFALTANNITYAVYGDRLGYWRVFPAPDGWGRVPAWGYARVVASRSPGLEEGRRVVGLVPMGTRFTVTPEPHPLGFTDAAAHRAELSPVYNQYLHTDDTDEAALLMRPLFFTSIILDLVLSEAETVVLTSASSRTAYGLAHLLQQRSVTTIGLTSPQRTGWVESLGLYDRVLAYDRIHELEAPRATLVDFAGDRRLLAAVHEQLALRRSILVGFTHREAARDDAPIPPPKPEFFFAPTEMSSRGRELGRRYAEAWPAFAPVVRRVMRIEPITDGAGLEQAYRALVEGRADPAAGYVASL